MRTLKIMAFGLLVLALSGVALHADTLVLTSGYNNVDLIVNNVAITDGGGSLGGSSSTLNGASLPWVFCVDLHDYITVPGTYSSTTVTNDASMTGLNGDSQGLNGFNGGSGTVKNAAQVAYLLQTYAAGAMNGTGGSGTSADQQAALQAAIWHVIYGGGVNGVDIDPTKNNASILADYATYIANVGSGNIQNFDWLSPGNNLQGLVCVPDGGMTLILLGGTLVGVETLRRKFRV